MTEESRSVDELLGDLELIQKELHGDLDSIANKWYFHFGPLRVRGRFSPVRFAQIYVVFNLGLFIIGGASLLLGGAVRELGIAIIVGVIFSVGAFLAQLWGMAVNRQEEVFSYVMNKEAKLKEMRDLRIRELAIIDEIRKRRESSA